MPSEEKLSDLFLTKLELYNFRNYHHLILDEITPLTLLVGENAVGKTNIIEAIQLITELKSFRASHKEELIHWGEQNSQVNAHFTNNSRLLEIKLQVSEEERVYTLNGKKKRIQDLKGVVPSVTFCPDDLTLVKGSPEKRREGFDSLGLQLSKNFYSVRSDYQRLIKQKNQALKEDMPAAFIESINDVIAKVGAQYIIHRLTLIDKISPFIKRHYSNISSSKDNFSLQYTFSWEGAPSNLISLDKEDLTARYREALTSHLPQEQEVHRSKYGPHADKIDFYLDEKNALQFASQGQQRSIVLAYKLAEVDLIQEVLHQKPLLLLDDVMSELDEGRRAAFTKLIQQGIQTFITTTNLSYFEEDTIRKARVLHLPLKGNE